MHSEDLAKVFGEMHLKGLYKEIMFLLDTCEAFSMFDQIEAPNLYMIATSDHEQSAVAQDIDQEIGNYLSDNFSRDFFEFLESPGGYRAMPDFSFADFPT